MKFRVEISRYYDLDEREKTILEKIFNLKFKRDEWKKTLYRRDFEAGDVYIEIKSLRELIDLAEKMVENKLVLESEVGKEDIFVISRDTKTGEWILEIYNEWRE